MHPECQNGDSVAVSSPQLTDEAIKRVVQKYLTSMILPYLHCSTRIVERDEQILILNKTEYLKQYSDVNSRRFMRLFIETSMFSVYLVSAVSSRTKGRSK